MPGAGLFTASIITIIISYFPGLFGPLFDAMGIDMDVNTAIEARELLFEFLRTDGPDIFKEIIVPLAIEIAKNYLPWI